MPLDAVTDFLSNDDMAETFVYTKGTAKSIRGVWVYAYGASNVGSMSVQNAATSVLVADADVVGVDRTATITRDAVVYGVVEVQPDGNGMTELILSKV